VQQVSTNNTSFKIGGSQMTDRQKIIDLLAACSIKKFRFLEYFTFTALPAWLLTVEIKAFPQTNSSHSR
jgi:hypothetical protein